MSGSLGENTKGKSFDHGIFTKILRNSVNDLKQVDYNIVKSKEADLDIYIKMLSNANIPELSKYAQLALYINAYNAFTLKLIIENKGIKSIKDIPAKKRWKHKRWSVDSRLLSLDEIENKIIRAEFKEPRIHFACVCASFSCPPLRNEAFKADSLNEQLNDQAKTFLSSNGNFIYNESTNTLRLSSIFDWYLGDFGGREKLVEYIQPFISDTVYEKIRSNIQNIKIEYLPYDWRLNGNWNQ